MSYEVPHFINGKTLISGSKKLDVYNPAQGEKIGVVGVADQAIVEQAVLAAKTAFGAWSATTAQQRAKILFRYKALLDQHLPDIAKLLTLEHGKTLTEATGSIQRGIDVLEFACGMPSHLKGEFAEEVSQGMDCYSMHQPLGVCVGITPFNFPAMIPLWMFPIAIACGNTFIIKPSEKDPSCVIKLAELAKEAGVPDGVVNVLQGDKDTVQALITHPDVNAVSFVGSSAVAKQVYQTSILHGKRAQAFGGAKNHCVVMPDADLDQAANDLVLSAYGSAGERCMAISVVVAVGDDVADALIKKMQTKIEKFNLDMSPLITAEHWQRVKSYVELGIKEGASLIMNGLETKPSAQANGFYMGCSLFDHVKPTMRVYQEEIFGPVLCIIRVPDLAAAIQCINTHSYANGTAIYTASGYHARHFAEKIQVGMVGINVSVPVPVPQHSFGGWKQSIFADIGMFGPEAIRFYTKLKTVTARWLKRTTS